MKLFHPDPVRIATAITVIAFTLGVFFAFLTVWLVTILVFSFEKVPM